jgi:hypothetical protein
MIERPTTGEQVAGVAGLALILTMFLFAWFGVDVPGVNGFDAFDAFDDWFNIILVFAAFGGMALALVGSGSERSPVALSVVTTVLAGLGALILLIYIISPPGVPSFGETTVEIDMNREFGVFLGLIELVALAIGGYMVMQEEGTSFGGAADRLSDPGTHQPPAHQHVPPPAPPAGQPAQPQYDPPPQQAPPPPPQAPPAPGPPPPPQQQPPPPPPAS